MKSHTVRTVAWLQVLLGSGCQPIVDDVFRSVPAPEEMASTKGSGGTMPPRDAGAPEPPRVALDGREIVVSETAGRVVLELALAMAAPVDVTADVVPVAVEAQANCFLPDFAAERTRVSWSLGERSAEYEVEIVDDETAEIDETIVLRLEGVEGADVDGLAEVALRIADDDRSDLIDAEARFDVLPDSSQDQSENLQGALDLAASSGRGVVELAPGDYVISSVVVSAGTSLVGHGATLHRPPNAGADLVTIRAGHSGDEDSAMTLVQGITLDGHRDEQGPFEALEQQNAHLLFFGGDPLEPGRLRVEVLGTAVRSGTGDGLAIGPNADVTACDVTAHDAFREGLSVHGGNTRLRLRGFTASAQLATCGMWLDGDIVGFPESRVVDLVLEDVRLETGDLEVSIAAGSNLEFSNLVMGKAPFRLAAPDSTVLIQDSVLWLGIPTDRHNHFRAPDDVRIASSTIVLSESFDEETALEEMDRAWAGVRVVWPDGATGAGSLAFEDCRFELAGDVEATDSVSIAESAAAGGELVIRGSSAGCACDWFATTCLGCSLEP